MENVSQLYKAALSILQQVQEKEQALRQKLHTQQSSAADACARIKAHYADRQQQLEEQKRSVETYYHLAKTTLGSSMAIRDNGKAPDLAYMQHIYVQIEDADTNDPYARQLMELSAGALGYLEKQKKALEQQQAAEISRANAGAGSQDVLAQKLQKLYTAFFSSDAVQRLAAATKAQTDPYFIQKQTVYDLAPPPATTGLLKLGAVQRPFPVPTAYEGTLKTLFGTYYDDKTKTLRLPFGFRTDRAVKLLLTYPDKLNDRAQTAMCGLLFNLLRHYAPISQRVVYIDPITYNPEHLGVLKPFAADRSFICFPTSEKQTLLALDRLLSTNSGDSTNRESRFLIVRGYPDHLSAAACEKIRNICNNYEFYRISVILTGTQSARHTAPQDDTALNKALRIYADEQRFYLQQGEETAPFAWFTAPRQLTPEMVTRFSDAYTPKLLGCVYPDRVDLKQLPKWTKGNRHICVPFGVDEHDGLCSIDFGGTNFAMYLMGAAGSGKSTLLHTIITGLIRNYHPDDVELWLADFKMSEFSQYADPLPPHIKYILMDESTELIYDFVDILTEKMMERKRYFSRNPNTKKLENVPADTYMPAIVVIIDEFSLMSQAVADSPVYKERLQNLLTEGRALGFKFIFASQEYSNGIQGLTAAAKDQVQMRIAMKNTATEIKQTLELGSGGVSEQVNEWIRDLPPHVALYKTFDAASHQTVLRRAQVMYFAGDARQAYAPQRQLIQSINAALTPVAANRYRSDAVNTYVDKKPVIADGNTCKAFSSTMFNQALHTFRQNPNNLLLDEDVPVIFGEPRRLLHAAVQPLINESRENLLLLSGDEPACSMSVMLSVMEAFRQQGGNVQVWAYRRDRIYISYRNSHFVRFQTCDTPETIGRAILQLKKRLQSKTQSKELIVMLGMDHVRQDMEALSQQELTAMTDAFHSLAAVTEQEKAAVETVRQYQRDLSAEMDRIQEQGLRDGKSLEQIALECEKLFESYRDPGAQVPMVVAEQSTGGISAEQPLDFEKDLEYIVTQGSKYGCHFLLCCRDYAQFRNTLPKLTLFSHKLAFQISADDSAYLFGHTRASKLPAHICQYVSDHASYSFRPFLHRDVYWDEWTLDSNGTPVRSL